MSQCRNQEAILIIKDMHFLRELCKKAGINLYQLNLLCWAFLRNRKTLSKQQFQKLCTYLRTYIHEYILLFQMILLYVHNAHFVTAPFLQLLDCFLHEKGL